jgi:hypothetical protein
MSSEGGQYHRDFTTFEEAAEGLRFEGDYYWESPDNVSRGVEMGFSEAMAHPVGTGNDLYHDSGHGELYYSANLKRSACSGSCAHAFMADSLGSGCGGQLPSSGPDSPFEAGAPSEALGADALMLINLPGRFVFEPIDEPPLPPADEYWKFEVTTIHTKTERPREGYMIGNHLMAFLRNDVVSSIRKVRTPSKTKFPKFSIKADVFIENIMCTLKIRVYQDKGRDSSCYCVEFQRRSGDCVSFNRAYQKAYMYLMVHFGAPAGGGDSFAPAQPLLHDDTVAVVVTQEEIIPLLDMAGKMQRPSLQAESATALAGLAQDRTGASIFCNENAFERVKVLLLSDQNAVAYPTARLLSSLAQFAEATRYFVTQGVLQAILEKVRSQATSALVQKLLVQTLSIAISRCVPLLSDETVGELLDGLSAAAKAGPVKDEGLDTAGEKVFHRSLQDAKSTLLQHRLAASGAGGGGRGTAAPESAVKNPLLTVKGQSLMPDSHRAMSAPKRKSAVTALGLAETPPWP